MSGSILFNGLKHHRQIIRDFVRDYPPEQLPDLEQALLPIGNSQMDLYTGTLSETAIGEEVIGQLIAMRILNREEYIAYLQPHFYQSVVLSDASHWILRLGERDNQHVHIHPARYSPHTLRVKATTLKTAIAVRIWQKANAEAVAIATLNQIRKTALALSPIRSLEETQSLQKILAVLA